jgi:hypothetical protein
MMKSLTTLQQGTLRGFAAGLFALMLAVIAMPAQAQMEDGELPQIDFSVNLMQSAQFLSVDDNNPYSRASLAGNHHGFHQIRAGLNANVQFSENVSGLLMLEQEPNDFGQSNFSPAVDFAVLNLQLTDQLTFQAGTPVTGLINFRGFSDGPVVQGNPLIGNSPADMITAGQGVKLIGSYPSFGFDLTVNRGFAESFSNETTGVNVIGKVRYTGSETFKVGAGGAFQTGNFGLIFANGDRENYNFAGSPISSKETHANLPNEQIFQADGKVLLGSANIDAWVGYASADVTNPISGDEVTAASLFGGLGAKVDLSEDFYLAGRFTYVGNNSDGADEADHTTLSRAQIGFGYEIYDKALFKLEGVRQVEGANSFGQIGNNWSGVTTELSFNF